MFPYFNHLFKTFFTSLRVTYGSSRITLLVMLIQILANKRICLILPERFQPWWVNFSQRKEYKKRQKTNTTNKPSYEMSKIQLVSCNSNCQSNIKFVQMTQVFELWEFRLFWSNFEKTVSRYNHDVGYWRRAMFTNRYNCLAKIIVHMLTSSSSTCTYLYALKKVIISCYSTDFIL